MKLNWNFLGGWGGGGQKKPSMGGVWIFSGTVQFEVIFNAQRDHITALV